MIEYRTTNARGILCGESQPACRWPDSIVAEARAMRAAGSTLKQIADHFGIPHHATVWNWVSGRGRKPAARIVARRIPPKQSVINHQQPGENPASARPAGASDSIDTATNTVMNPDER